MSISNQQSVLEEYLDLKKKIERERFRATSQHTKQFDPFTVYARDMPSELIGIRYNFQSDFLDAMTMPICLELATISYHNIMYVESVMSKWLSLADILYDDNIARKWPILAGDNGPLPDDWVDTTQLEGQEEEAEA